VRPRAGAIATNVATLAANRRRFFAYDDVRACVFALVAHALNEPAGMGVARPTATTRKREYIAREHVLMTGPDLKPCPLCGDMTPSRGLCPDCADHARPHQAGDPYDDLGGEN
jgi:hypothetical protein